MTTTREATDEQVDQAFACKTKYDAYRLGWEDAIVGVLADPSVLLPEAEWRLTPSPGGTFCDLHERATVLGVYRIRSWDGKSIANLGDEMIDDTATVDEAKAACEAHYRDVVRKMFGVK